MTEELPKRLPPAAETIKFILIRSGNQCAFTGCMRSIFNDANQLIGECCHIESALPGGQRFNADQTNEQRRSADNLMFMCHDHHVETDDVMKFPMQVLKKIKYDHEARFNELPITIQPNYVSDVLALFSEIGQDLKNTLELTNQVKSDTEKILSHLTKREAPVDDALLQFPIPINLNFVGRNAELTQFKTALINHNTLSVCGLSGIGKTSFLAEVLKKREGCIWLDCANDDLTTVLVYLADSVQQQFGDKTINQILKSSTPFQATMQAVAQCINLHGAVIVLDNVNDRLEAFVPLITVFNRHFKMAKIILTLNSRLDMAILANNCHQQILSGLNERESLHLLNIDQMLEGQPEVVKAIIDCTQGHPYIIKLISVLCRDTDVHLLFTELKDLPGEEVNDYVKKKIVDGLSDEQQELLFQLAILDIPVRLTGVSYLTSKIGLKVFYSLLDKYLITAKKGPEYLYFVHDLVKNYIKNTPEDFNHKFVIQGVDYLASLAIKSPSESIQLINFCIKLNLLEKAREEARILLSTMLANGYFQLALDVAAQLEEDPKTNDWDYIYYVQGRVFRFIGDHEKALIKYNKGINLAKGEFRDIIEFEIASTLTNYSKEGGGKSMIDAATLIYQRLIASKNQTLSIQSQISLGTIRAENQEYEAAIDLLLPTLKIAEALENPQNTIPAALQIIGNCYSKMEKYDDAIIYYKDALLHYGQLTLTFGMNIFDGLYYNYQNLAWTYSKAKYYSLAAETFELAAELAESHSFLQKQEQSLFDQGYNLLVDRQFESALTILLSHYDLIVKNNLMSEIDMKLTHGALVMALWYGGKPTGAIEVMGLLIQECNEEGFAPKIMIMEEKDLRPEVNIMEFFQQNVYFLILGNNKTFKDLQVLIEDVIIRMPHLATSLNTFRPLRSPE
ncbi:tetratricopeptide repeat protein [Mucilaginibacter sp.]|uniref:tetratricopeptide repeat protein n=1 Tax=Mucilaginibacter sp. TaxID=1882438 RepID=UPI003D0E5EDA